jgi:hypothetical protein
VSEVAVVARWARLLLVGILALFLLQLVVGRAVLQLWRLFGGPLGLEPAAVNAAVVVPHVLLQIAGGYLVARVAGVRRLLPDALVIATFAAALVAVSYGTVPDGLQPGAGRVCVGMVVVAAGVLAGSWLSLRVVRTAGAPS